MKIAQNRRLYSTTDNKTKPFTNVCSGQLSLLPSAGWKMSSSLQVRGWRHSVADWGGASNEWLHNALQYH